MPTVLPLNRKQAFITGSPRRCAAVFVSGTCRYLRDSAACAAVHEQGATR
jgi:hypothetical protein